MVTSINNDAVRPINVLFNGGPVSASVWMHFAYSKPRVLKNSQAFFWWPVAFEHGSNLRNGDM